MQLEIKQLGRLDNVDVLNRFVNITDKHVIDAGCGSLTFSRVLAQQGANVLAIDPDAQQAKINRQAALEPNIQFLETGADNIPRGANSIDGVFFSYSLHHIPSKLYPNVFEEIQRLLKPSGFLYFIEPIDCPFNEVMKLFHNEDRERADAWHFIEQLAERFEHAEAVEYHGEAVYESWEHFTERLGRRTYNPGYTFEDVCNPTVKSAFEHHAEQSDGGFTFKSPKRAVFMEHPIQK